MSDRPEYLARKSEFRRMLTVYGRNPVREALLEKSVQPVRLHLSRNNRPGPAIDELLQLAGDRAAEVVRHTPEQLARISRNARQDQGVALDVRCPAHRELDDLLENAPLPQRLLAVDGITNPQNLGMLIRSAAAGGIGAILVPRKGCTEISPLVIKASAGALFRAPLVRCDELPTALVRLQEQGCRVAVLAGDAEQQLGTRHTGQPTVYVLGNETGGVSPAVRKLADVALSIPMHNGIESLNVAVTAALIAYLAH